jgi:hypothetical protein
MDVDKSRCNQIAACAALDYYGIVKRKGKYVSIWISSRAYRKNGLSELIALPHHYRRRRSDHISRHLPHGKSRYDSVLPRTVKQHETQKDTELPDRGFWVT